MGEKEKKPEEGKKEAAEAKEKPEAKDEETEAKADERKDRGGGREEEKKEGGDEETKAEAPAPPPRKEIEMRVFMHCEGCARKVKRSLKGLEGDEVSTFSFLLPTMAKGKKATKDPTEVVERVQKKTGRKVELLTPLPPPKPEKKEEEKPKAEEEKEEPQVIAVVIKVHMHCEACAQQIKKRILKMKRVLSVETDLKASQVTVKGAFVVEKLVEYVYKRTGKHTVVAKQEPVKKSREEKKTDVDAAGGDAAKEEKKADETCWVQPICGFGQMSLWSPNQ
ncbi:heavy metal-associated isoprenylated plant protein 7-like [Musa acuminata AAA Group]|uniref:heavy metal-associated isoprenylated plant protein 7-like n=1 Tax=Musa acuminata AAA Group TaxID=214697 RepID=UPI0031D02625